MNRRPIKNLSRIFVLGVILFVFNSCGATIGYMDVRVNGYTGGKPTLSGGKKVFVYNNAEAINPLLEDEIGNKIKTALNLKGYVPVEQLADADYLLRFEYGIDQGNTVPTTSSYTTGGGYELNVFTGQMEKTSPTTHVSSGTRTTFSRGLILYVFEAQNIAEKSKPAWIGEVNSRGSSSDLRKAIDYLIVGAFEHFGTDTDEQKRHFYLLSSDPFKKLETP